MSRDLFAPHPLPLAPDSGSTSRIRFESFDLRSDKTCAVCGSTSAPFGFGVALLKGQIGRWSCAAHRDDVERMAR